ncbi:hypothetical protein D3C87_1621930 [compost metagenome]
MHIVSVKTDFRMCFGLAMNFPTAQAQQDFMSWALGIGDDLAFFSNDREGNIAAFFIVNKDVL